MATMREVQQALGMTTADFRKEYVPLSDKDKADLKEWTDAEAES